MFDVLLRFVQRQCVPLLRLYNKEYKKKDGVMVVIEEKRSADVRFFEPDNIPYDHLKKELKEKKSMFNGESLIVKDRWIVDLPLIKKDDVKKTPLWYLILDDTHHQTLFVGVPEDHGDYVKYVMVADPHHITVAKHCWEKEATTKGQKYLRACFEASKNPLNYMIFRSNSQFCDIIDMSVDHKLIKDIGDVDSKVIDIIEKLDDIGSAITRKVDGIGHIADDTLRHLWTATMIKKRFGNVKRN